MVSQGDEEHKGPRDAESSRRSGRAARPLDEEVSEFIAEAKAPALWWLRLKVVGTAASLVLGLVIGLVLTAIFIVGMILGVGEALRSASMSQAPARQGEAGSAAEVARSTPPDQPADVSRHDSKDAGQTPASPTEADRVLQEWMRSGRD